MSEEVRVQVGWLGSTGGDVGESASIVLAAELEAVFAGNSIVLMIATVTAGSGVAFSGEGTSALLHAVNKSKPHSKNMENGWDEWERIR